MMMVVRRTACAIETAGKRVGVNKGGRHRDRTTIYFANGSKGGDWQEGQNQKTRDEDSQTHAGIKPQILW
jgi:hypothetical protein